MNCRLICNELYQIADDFVNQQPDRLRFSKESGGEPTGKNMMEDSRRRRRYDSGGKDRSALGVGSS